MDYAHEKVSNHILSNIIYKFLIFRLFIFVCVDLKWSTFLLWCRLKCMCVYVNGYWLNGNSNRKKIKFLECIKHLRRNKREKKENKELRKLQCKKNKTKQKLKTLCPSRLVYVMLRVWMYAFIYSNFLLLHTQKQTGEMDGCCKFKNSPNFVCRIVRIYTKMTRTFSTLFCSVLLLFSNI